MGVAGVSKGVSVGVAGGCVMWECHVGVSIFKIFKKLKIHKNHIALAGMTGVLAEVAVGVSGGCVWWVCQL